ncbi:Bro-N domain-containing protein [Acinetobacter sp. Leaf130]|uniref:BRO-N domain-containing protein n=1 Tax=Acinetobacter sp. Leaf130 TaxID=1736269 RepID=UPI000700804C|nr:BRO family protein [Acinetobacter sp. Leaf130]KQQ77223.1 alpha/beta hydrolase [Acinetobacter sp. Leaf130]
MSSLALSFNDVNFQPVQHNQQIWLTASELAKALGYAKTDAVTQIYERNKDEFTNEMTTTFNLRVVENIETLNLSVSKKDKNLLKTVRVFNPRGCHLITFFARTSVAKQFRKWVLDVLDKEIGQPVAKTHKSERTPLHDAHALLVAKTKHLNSSDAWKIINQRFGTNSIDEIPYDMIPVAVEYVHHLIAMYSSAEKKSQGSLFDKEAYELVRKLTEAVIIENDEIFPVLLAVKMLDMKKFAYYSHLVVKANEAARDISRLLDFRNLQNEPLIDADCSVIAMSNGQRFLARPNWFNCPA